MFNLFKRDPTKKPYDPTAWEKRVSVETMQANYDKAGWSGEWGEWRQRSVDYLAERISELYERGRQKVTVVDVACFTGDYFGRLMEKPKIGDLLQYTGVDVTPKYVKHCQERWKPYQNASFKVSSALGLSFPDHSFDMVFNSGMLIHVADPETCIKEFCRVAKHYALIETSVDYSMTKNVRDEDKSGRSGAFIDRVYKPAYIESLIGKVAKIVDKNEVPYRHMISTLYCCRPFGPRLSA